jgi:hypothetical protein
VPPESFLAIVALLAIGLVLGLVLAASLRSRASRARNRVAGVGELEAERILDRAGYRVVDRQVVAAWSILVDGEEIEAWVRADLVVTKKGRRYVAEVKTGDKAPDPCHPPTRRQLLEYALVFGSEEILLVDVPARAIRRIEFPAISRARRAPRSCA